MNRLTFAITAILIIVTAHALCAEPPQSRSLPRPRAISTGPASQVDAIINDSVDTMWAQTDAYWHLGDYPRIVALDRIITQADPRFQECYATGGWLLESMRRNKEAEAFYQEGIHNNPTSSYLYYSLGFFYYNAMHDYPAAVRVFEKDSHLSNAELNDWKMLAHSYEHAHLYDKAIATWRTIQARWSRKEINDPLQRGVIEMNLNRAVAMQKAALSTSPSDEKAGK